MEDLNLYQKYLLLLDENKKTSRILKFFTYSYGQEKIKIFLIVLAAAYIEAIFPTYFISLLISFIFCINYYHLHDFRESVSIYCIVEEGYMNLEYEKMDVDPNYPHDPLYVTDSERKLILEEQIRVQELKGTIKRIKKHSKFSIVYILIYFLLYFIFNQSIHCQLSL